MSSVTALYSAMISVILFFIFPAESNADVMMLWRDDWLQQVRSEMESNPGATHPALDAVIADADLALSRGPYSVTDKTGFPEDQQVVLPVQERAAAQSLELLRYLQRHARPLELFPRFLRQQARVPHQSFDTIVLSRLAFLGRQIREELRMRPARSCRLFGNHRILLPKGRQA